MPKQLLSAIFSIAFLLMFSAIKSSAMPLLFSVGGIIYLLGIFSIYAGEFVYWFILQWVKPIVILFGESFRYLSHKIGRGNRFPKLYRWLLLAFIYCSAIEASMNIKISELEK